MRKQVWFTFQGSVAGNPRCFWGTSALSWVTGTSHLICFLSGPTKSSSHKNWLKEPIPNSRAWGFSPWHFSLPKPRGWTSDLGRDAGLEFSRGVQVCANVHKQQSGWPRSSKVGPNTLHKPSSWGVLGPKSNGAASHSQPGLLLNIAQAWCKMPSQRKTNSFHLQTYLVCTDLKILPLPWSSSGGGAREQSRDDWILYEGLGQRTAIAYHIDPCRAQFSACWLNKKIQKLRQKKYWTRLV